MHKNQSVFQAGGCHALSGTLPSTRASAKHATELWRALSSKSLVGHTTSATIAATTTQADESPKSMLSTRHFPQFDPFFLHSCLLAFSDLLGMIQLPQKPMPQEPMNALTIEVFLIMSGSVGFRLLFEEVVLTLLVLPPHQLGFGLHHPQCDQKRTECGSPGLSEE